MATTGHKETWRRRSAEHRRDRCDVRKVGAAMKRIVAEPRVSLAQIFHISRGDLLKQILDTFSHRPQMHRDMRSIRHQFALTVEQGTGEVEPFADVHRTTALP